MLETEPDHQITPLKTEFSNHHFRESRKNPPSKSHTKSLFWRSSLCPPYF